MINVLKSIVNRDLARTQGSMLQMMGSFSGELGFAARTASINGVNHNVVTWGNRIIKGAGDTGAKWVGINAANNSIQGFQTLAGASNFARNSTSAFAQAKTAIGGAGVGGILGIGFAAWAGADAYKRGEGLTGAGIAAGRTLVETVLIGKALGVVVSNPYLLAGAAAGVATYMAFKGKEQGNRYLHQSRRSEMSGHVNPAMMTRQAFTMRQRAKESMQSSYFNAMRSIGNEASFNHMPKSRYGNTEFYSQSKPILGY